MFENERIWLHKETFSTIKIEDITHFEPEFILMDDECVLVFIIFLD